MWDFSVLIMTQLSQRLYIGWKATAGAVGVAWDKIRNDGILHDYDTLNLTWVFSDCIESTDAGALISWVDSKADVVLGPPCSNCEGFLNFSFTLFCKKYCCLKYIGFYF
ncbi:unnamed protein product [Haemonchus placei]|uniref:ANF_receptor domain-containing protein n=1 Tax=Haemonchus placei TaxID=6290 RepID=A0A0N4VZH9_HAEPC|nr:unnamed protein product [Haemonchus placei]